MTCTDYDKEGNDKRWRKLKFLNLNYMVNLSVLLFKRLRKMIVIIV